MSKRPNRSDSYRMLFHEISCSYDMLSSFCNEDSIQARLNPFDYNEDLIELEDRLKKEFWRVVNTLLTDRRREVIRLYADGYTRMEIAKILGVNQSSITKSINGNTSYEDKNDKRIYGGSKKKIRKIIESDEKILDILKKIEEIRSEKW